MPVFDFMVETEDGKNPTQFLIRSPKKTDLPSILLFKKVIAPLRRRTGWTAQRIGRFVQYILFFYLMVIAGYYHNVSADIMYILFGLILLATHWHQVKQLTPLSTDRPDNWSTEIITVLNGVLKTRKNSIYWWLGLSIWFALTSTPKNDSFVFIFWYLGWATLDYIRDTCMTCGGYQRKIAREKKFSFNSLMRLNVLPNQG